MRVFAAVGLLACALACAPERIELGDGTNEELVDDQAEDAGDGSGHRLDGPHPDQFCGEASSAGCELVDECDHEDFLVLICGETEELCERCGDCLTCDHGIDEMCSADHSAVLSCEGDPCFVRLPCEGSECEGGFEEPYCVDEPIEPL